LQVVLYLFEVLSTPSSLRMFRERLVTVSPCTPKLLWLSSQMHHLFQAFICRRRMAAGLWGEGGAPAAHSDRAGVRQATRKRERLRKLFGPAH